MTPALNIIYFSAQIVNLFEGIATIPVERILEACGIIVKMNENEAFKQYHCKWHCVEYNSKVRGLGAYPQRKFPKIGTLR